ncbi:MAG: 1-deoxy-D-xylulose-5-phosphate synthase [Gammaproteobacteria bacterium]
MQAQIMYIEEKPDDLKGEGRIGLVGFSKTGKTLYFQGRVLAKTSSALKANYFDEDTGDYFWISRPTRTGEDSLFPALVRIDPDVRVEYWTEIRKSPSRAAETEFRSPGRSKTEKEKMEKGLRRRGMDSGW